MGLNLHTGKTEHSVVLSCILEEYHKFADVFSKAKADTLALYQPYDLKINLEEGSKPSVWSDLLHVTL